MNECVYAVLSQKNTNTYQIINIQVQNVIFQCGSRYLMILLEKVINKVGIILLLNRQSKNLTEYVEVCILFTINLSVMFVFFREDSKEYRSWKKSIMLVFNRMATHKYASIFLRPITNEQAPAYDSVIQRQCFLLLNNSSSTSKNKYSIQLFIISSLICFRSTQ